MATTIRNIKSVLPTLDRILVQRFKPQEKTASGLYLPSSSTASPLPEATVIATGPGIRDSKTGDNVPNSVKSGDKVLLPGWGGSSIKVGEEEYYLFRDSEILAKIQE
ncbi:hypothetical protein E3P92_02435 [Wallemia ichthyophaga]|uniref:10 kDa heat shock protein, mitochondrial n=2 Tax=Wallemia ichthyophaga TaxID=245174 RepID=A0A4T0JE40_WALIC|nr:uncharacterized protein J056_001927 [Wallemia ichthyophaga EXF-994]TIA81108.1 hypothetical protein E3P98_02252 [Wallemia ichthyophaga]EOQ99371.1 hypothetical protein J056_001927 [Wallemia ichthyophaga EXF-994]TIA90626.1 hypothetical protein E3P97_02448 [Wallemia ichthyophaga]TIA99432.1 hypothetical protein E3P95_02090 [Wallemia ichthyophaga]TIB00330.1 hypothetical protein E3P94_02214 [Wallemia ichthyophaga]